MNTWNDLSLSEKSEMMRVAIENGITTLPEIKEAYNEFAKGGYAPSRAIKDRIIAYEGKAMTGAKDPVTGKWGKNSSFESEAARFYNVLPDSIRNQVLSNPELADNLYSYSYNVGAGNFKKRVVPALERYYAGEGSIKDIENSMWASNDAKLRGLQRRRAEEKEGVRNALLGEVISSLPTEQELPAFMPSNPQAFFTPIESYQSPVVVEEPLVQAAMENPYSPEQLEREERAQGLRNLGLAMSIMRGGQEQSYSPLWSAVSMLAGNQMAKGGKIHIKPENRGKFTALKKRTGHSATWFKQHGTPAQKKMATFALNAKKWKHGLGGNLFSGEDEPTQQMNSGLNLYRRTNNLGETEYIYQETPDSEEILLTPTNKRFSDDPTNWDYVDASGREYSPRMVKPASSSTLEASEKMGPLEKYVAELNWRMQNDPASIALQGKYTMPAIAAAPFLAWAGEAAYPYVSAALSNPYVDAGLTSAFAGHGLNHTINEGINGWGDAAMTALELAPLGQLARPVYNAGKEGLQYVVNTAKNAANVSSESPLIASAMPDYSSGLGLDYNMLGRYINKDGSLREVHIPKTVTESPSNNIDYSNIFKVDPDKRFMMFEPGSFINYDISSMSIDDVVKTFGPEAEYYKKLYDVAKAHNFEGKYAEIGKNAEYNILNRFAIDKSDPDVARGIEEARRIYSIPEYRERFNRWGTLGDTFVDDATARIDNVKLQGRSKKLDIKGQHGVHGGAYTTPDATTIGITNSDSSDWIYNMIRHETNHVGHGLTRQPSWMSYHNEKIRPVLREGKDTTSVTGKYLDEMDEIVERSKTAVEYADRIRKEGESLNDALTRLADMADADIYDASIPSDIRQMMARFTKESTLNFWKNFVGGVATPVGIGYGLSQGNE